jgi:amino acid transporter
MYNAVSPGILAMQVDDGQCIPVNSTFTEPLTGLFNIFIGGIGGLLVNYGIIAGLVVVAVVALVNIVRKRRAGEEFSAILWLAAIVPILILAVLAVVIVFRALNGLCGLAV